MLEEWVEFWMKYLYIILLTMLFTFIGVTGRFLRDMKVNKTRFSMKAFLIEFLISLSLTIFLALACISRDIDVLTTCIVVGIGSHFGTNGIVRLICYYIRIDCSKFMQNKENTDK